MDRREFVKTVAASPIVMGMAPPLLASEMPVQSLRKWPAIVLMDNPSANGYFPLYFAEEVKSVHRFGSFKKRPHIERDIKLGWTETFLLYGAKISAPKETSDLLKSSWSGSKLRFHPDHRGTDCWYDKMEDAGAVESFMGPLGAAFPHIWRCYMIGWGVGPDLEGFPPDMKGTLPDHKSFQGYFCGNGNRIVVEMNHFQGWDLSQIEVELIMARYTVKK